MMRPEPPTFEPPEYLYCIDGPNHGEQRSTRRMIYPINPVDIAYGPELLGMYVRAETRGGAYFQWVSSKEIDRDMLPGTLTVRAIEHMNEWLEKNVQGR